MVSIVTLRELFYFTRDEHNYADLTKSVYFSERGCGYLLKSRLLLEQIDSFSVYASLNSPVLKVPGKPHSLFSFCVKFPLLMVGQVKYVHALT